jgi:hypothetical protein
MKIVIETGNPFYEGWLSRLFRLADREPSPYDEEVIKQGWQCGWDTAKETSEFGLGFALLAEAKLGTHLTVKAESRGVNG